MGVTESVRSGWVALSELPGSARPGQRPCRDECGVGAHLTTQKPHPLARDRVPAGRAPCVGVCYRACLIALLLTGQRGPGTISGKKLLVSNYRHMLGGALGASAVSGQLSRRIKEPAMLIGLIIVIALVLTFMMLRRHRRL
jgi:hypothetical protein